MATPLYRPGRGGWRRWATALIAVILLTAMNATGANAASGEADASPPTTTAEPDVAYVVKKYGISPAEAAQRLARQDLAPLVEREARRRLGSHFGGIWLDIAQDRIVVGNAGGTPDLSGLSADGRLTGHIVTEPVRHTLAELEATAADLRRHFKGSKNFAVDRIDLATNHVAVWRTKGAIAEPALERYLSSKAAMIHTQLTAAQPVIHKTGCRPRADWGPIYCDVPLRGGIAIGSDYTNCSGGFIGKSTSDAKLYVITAGHCLATDPTVFRTRFFSNLELHDIGIRHSYRDNSTQDFGAIYINNPSGWHPEATVTVLSGPNTVADEHYDVPATGANTAGMVVCSTFGRTGFTACGTVLALGVAAVGMTNLAVVQYDDGCASGGDSGSPVYKSHLARGILIAGSSDCSRFYYQGIADALNTLHLTLLLTD